MEKMSQTLKRYQLLLRVIECLQKEQDRDTSIQKIYLGIWRAKDVTSPEALPEKNKDYNLLGNYANKRECYILPDWLLVYRVEGSELVKEIQAYF